MKQQKEKMAVTVTPVAKNKTSGFEINSPKTLTPKSQSPSGSGRNSPDEDQKSSSRTKEVMRNARELFEKERGTEKQQLHLVVIGHVDAGLFTKNIIFYSFA